jgi:hypothetical protein
MKVLTALFLLMCIYGNASAQVLHARYNVTDMLDKKYDRIESWTIRPVAENGKVIFALIKNTPDKNRVQEMEITRRWSVEVHLAGQSTYLKKVLSSYPREMSAGEGSFGYIEERAVVGDEVLQSWPLFCRIEGIVGGLRAVYTTYLPDGRKLETIHDYADSETYYFPFRESHILKYGDEIQSHVIYAREK